MAIGAITMILANVGLQIYNNWCGSRQNDKLQQKREEFERAARERNTEHMWKLLREGQELTMQLEKEKHDDRLKELKDEVDHLLERLTYEATITNWPLKVLPIVMKNQAFGNLLANQEEHVALHVIFTRSNYDKFNKLVYPIVEKELEQYCDKHWSTVTDHPVLFYSGAWKSMSSPTDVQVTAMREELKNLPTLLITPFFRPNDGRLVFQLHMWGVGANSTDRFDVPEIEPKNDEFHFQRTYTIHQDYENERGLLDEIVEDIVPYLECMIGYMADTYFWASSGLAPHLPLLVTNGTINTDGMKYLINDSREYYDQLLLTSEENAKKNPFDGKDKLLNLYEGTKVILDDCEKRNFFDRILLTYCNPVNSENDIDISEALHRGVFSTMDLFFINKATKILKKESWSRELVEYLNEIKNSIHVSQTPTFKIIKKDKFSLLDILETAKIEFSNLDDYDCLGIIIVPNNFMVCCYYENLAHGYINENVTIYVSKHFYMPKTALNSVNKLVINKEDIKNHINKIKLIMTEKDLEKLFSDSSENSDSRFSKVIDAFQQAIDRIKKEFDDERRRVSPDSYEVPMVVKQQLMYEDLTGWIRSNSGKNNSFDGVFATIDKAGLFDRERYKMYVCFTINKNPQLDVNSPKIIFAFSKLDSALMDMFGKNKTLQINLNK